MMNLWEVLLGVCKNQRDQLEKYLRVKIVHQGDNLRGRTGRGQGGELDNISKVYCHAVVELR